MTDQLEPVTADAVLTAPLSYEQESLWLREKLVGRPGLFNAPTPLRLRGPLDVAALRAALVVIVARHAVLRTTITAVDDRPVQRISPRGELDFVCVDVPDEQAARLAGSAEIERDFDLGQGPLLRVRVYRIGPTDHVLVITMHHLITDAWSSQVLLLELQELYRAETTGRTARLPELTIDYTDFAIGQRAALSGDRLDQLREFWASTLADPPTGVALPSDRVPSAGRQGLGAAFTAPLPDALAARIQQVARQQRVTEFMLLLAAFRVLLLRHTGQRDLLIGVPTSDRDLPGTELLLGFFLNMLVMRNKLDPRTSFLDVLAAERATTLAAFDRKEMPFSHLVDLVRPNRDRSMSPLVQITFSFAPDGEEKLEFAGLAAADFELDSFAAQFDLGVDISRTEAGMVMLWGYNDDVYDHATITALARRFPILLAAALDRPDTPIGRLPVLTEADRARIDAAAPGTAAAQPSTLADMLTAGVARQPDAVAVRQGDATRTYAELLAGAERIRDLLAARALAPEDVVGMLVDRSVDLPASYLGVWLAGCAILPLDPTQPSARHHQLLVDAGARVLLTDDATPADPLGPPGLVTIAMPTDTPAPARPHGTTGPLPAHLAYLLYTSGSTGRSKGVAVEHRALANFMRVAMDTLGVGPGQRVLATTTVAFDISLLELFLPLVCGAELIVSTAEESRDGLALAGLVDRWQPDMLHGTPALWQLLRHSGWQGDPDLTALAGGDVLSPELADWLRRRTRGMHHLYGPTEATIYCLGDQVTGDVPGAALLPIGRPIGGVRAAVLDERLRPVPPGCVGELCVAGVALARGYHGMPATTATVFVPDPLGSPGARLYRTGDYARLLTDGRFELHGRRDRQVKVRGHRIELGEIEAALLRVPMVDEAVALVIGEEDDRRIVGFVVARNESGVDGGLLRSELAGELPGYLVPSEILVLGALPLTTNRKVDRAALAATAADLAVAETGTRAPETPGEELVARVWADVLRRPRVFADDDFFAIGGNSLLAAQVVGRLHREAELTVPMAALFDAPTVREFALRLTGPDDAADPLVWLRRAPRDRAPLVFAHAVGGSVLSYRTLVAALGPAAPVVALEGHGTTAGLTGLATGYLDRLAEDGVRPRVFVGWSFGGLIAFEMARQAAQRDAGPVHVVCVDTGMPASLDLTPETTEQTMRRQFADDLARSTGLPPVEPPHWLDTAPRTEFLDWLSGALGLADITDLVRRYELTAGYLATVRGYQPLPARVDMLFVAPARPRADPSPWQTLVDRFTLVSAPGDHHTVLTEGADTVAGLLDGLVAGLPD